MNILIRTDGSKDLGNGHIIRMLALADQLFLRKIQFTFALKFDDYWITRIRENKFRIIPLSQSEDHIEAFIKILKAERITHLVYDTRGDLTRAQLLLIKNATKIKVIVVDSPEDTRLVADVAIFPPIPQIKEWNWDGFNGDVYSGWEYVLLRKEFSDKRHIKTPNVSSKILLAFGSTDPFFLTEKMLALAARNLQMFKGFEFVLLAGPQFDRLSLIKESADYNSLRISVQQAPKDIVSLFTSVDLAFIAFGVTAYELSALSVPFLCISPTEDHERSVRVFEENDLCVSLGLINNFADNFQVKMRYYFENEFRIKNAISTFQSQHTISDWSKIIAAILN